VAKQLSAKASVGGQKLDKAVGAGKGSDACSNKDSRIVEHNAIKKQKMEAKRRDINVRIEKALHYLLQLRSMSYVCQT
jgi:hypothetical protein